MLDITPGASNAIEIYEFSGVTIGEDGAGVSGVSASGTALDSGPLTTAHPGELLVATFGSTGGTITITGMTHAIVNGVTADAWTQAGPPGTYHAAGASASSGLWGALLAGFY